MADLLTEAVDGLAARSTQTAVTVLGTVVGIGTLVATVAVATTAGNQIVAHVAALAATQIIAEPGESSDPMIDVAIGWHDIERIGAIDGVASIGAKAEIRSLVRVTTAPEGSREARIANIRVVAATPDLIDTVEAEVIEGRGFDAGHDTRADPVALVGTAAARSIGLRMGHTPRAIFLDDRPLVVIGIFTDAAAAPELLGSIVIPAGYALKHMGVSGPDRIHVQAGIGATTIVARQIPLALFPRDPRAIKVIHGPQATRLGQELSREVNALFLLLGALSLIVASLGIANTSLVTVLERTQEIGLRRALGIPRRTIGALFLTESVIVGAVGGLVGSCVGIVITVAVSAFRDWTPILEPWIPPSAFVLGMTVGLAAGAYPAVKAMRVEPVSALQGDR